jgi:DNA-binding winged helix-turn-helix (wHTH) protein/tetratricopeptide (TPR) repeat protein
MTSEVPSSKILRFAVFEVDLRTGELRRQGVRIKLQEQPFHVLKILLERSGEVVTREEFRSAIWQSDTFVDFDNGLNTSINKLREALGDSADSPRFVETLPRRGYRFIAPVTRADGTTKGTDQAVNAAVPPGTGKMVVAAVAVVVLAAGIAGGLFWRARQARHLTQKDTIVLGDFANSTGDAVFDGTLKQGLIVQLEQSPFLNILSEWKVAQTLTLMGRSPGQRLTPELARDLCQRVGSKAMLTGTISSLGTLYVIGLNAVNCETGETLASEQVEADSREHVLKALGESATKMREKLGESLASVQKYDAPLERTTSSLEALKAFSLGLEVWGVKGDTAALPFFQRAVEADPKFAAAYGRMGTIYYELGEMTLAAEKTHKAYELRDKVSAGERLYLESHYHYFVTGELEKAAQVFEVWQKTYPRVLTPYSNLASLYAQLGKYEKALEEAREEVRLFPDVGDSYYNVGSLYLNLGRFDEAEAAFRQAEERKLENEFLLLTHYQLAFLKGDTSKMAQLASAATGKPGTEDVLLAAQADTEGWYGKLKNAHELTQRAMDSALLNDAKETAAAYQAAASLREVESGNREQARADADMAIKLAPNRDVRAVGALALARAGATARAEKLAAELDKSFPLDTMVQRYWLPTIQSAVALERKDPNRAIELLKMASTIELSGGFIEPLCPIYVRGETHLMLQDGNAAAVEFQKFIDHRGIVGNFPWGALARLGLARSYAIQGDTAKAKAAYQDFLALWKDADTDVPILKKAQAEYAKLQ